MRFAVSSKAQHAVRTEQIILFRASNQIFAISSASVQEVRSADSLVGSAVEVNEPSIGKVRHAIRRGDRNLYVVNASLHFELHPSPTALIFVLRKSRVALLVDGIEKMTTMTRLQALPGAFCHEERLWYRGLTMLEQNVVPVVNPSGFLTAQEIALLDAISTQQDLAQSSRPIRTELNV